MSGGIERPGKGRLRTPSLRTRAVLVVLLVLLVVLGAVSIAVDRSFAVQTRRGAEDLLTSRAQLARQLARTGTGPQPLVNRVDGAGVRAELTLVDGRSFGAVEGDHSTGRTLTLSAPGVVDGGRLELAVDTAFVDKAQRALRRSLLIAGVLALLLAAVLVTVVLRFALRPLDAFASLAREVGSGRRGARLRPTRTDTELGKAAVAVDVMLDELEGAESRARHAEAVSRDAARRSQEFLADAAHELRTPAAGVRAAAESLLHQADALTDAEREQLLVLLVREAQRTGRLTDDLLVAANLDAGVSIQPVPVDLAEVIRAEVQRTTLLHPSLTVESAGWLQHGRSPGIVSDPVKVRSVVANLLSNAARAAGETGRLEISGGFEMTGGSEPGWVTVLVTDDGPGIPPADRERVFDRLVRLDADRTRAAAHSGGAGLGLAIARGYARAVGGDLRCVGPPPGVSGAAFLLVLPAGGPMPPGGSPVPLVGGPADAVRGRSG